MNTYEECMNACSSSNIASGIDVCFGFTFSNTGFCTQFSVVSTPIPGSGDSGVLVPSKGSPSSIAPEVNSTDIAGPVETPVNPLRSTTDIPGPGQTSVTSVKNSLTSTTNIAGPAETSATSVKDSLTSTKSVAGHAESTPSVPEPLPASTSDIPSPGETSATSSTSSTNIVGPIETTATSAIENLTSTTDVAGPAQTTVTSTTDIVGPSESIATSALENLTSTKEIPGPAETPLTSTTDITGLAQTPATSPVENLTSTSDVSGLAETTATSALESTNNLVGSIVGKFLSIKESILADVEAALADKFSFLGTDFLDKTKSIFVYNHGKTSFWTQAMYDAGLSGGVKKISCSIDSENILTCNSDGDRTTLFYCIDQDGLVSATAEELGYFDNNNCVSIKLKSVAV
ncbi:hypothetical protein TI39_contig277g00005 [Zymoseptoria brevis]|uniref:Uncharacterized protein n=1 Tax=Zymoseptoria brevis TaxID=1047168 RepID=A0A0F4H074_9PEZI|nr:hypothetical protein TI39_contig277g00005 [Zymoseptoria brevis]